MATTTGTHSGIASTITALEAELPQLEHRQKSLENDLAAVTQRLEIVRTAVAGLKALNGAPAPLPEPASTTTTPATPAAAAAPAIAEPESALEEQTPSTASAKTVPAPRRAKGTKAPRAVKNSTAADGRDKTPKTTTPKKNETRAARKATGTAKQDNPATTKRTRTPGLSKSIVAVLGKSKKPLRAGEVNELLGREKTDGSVNSVRTALERLVVNHDIQRVGRGLYQTT
ncbi:hypothetical protein NGB36_01895 [Streptomyces sp. RB6PN25]|uniref:Prephenate dehydrogenase n=1 Tax=Streptomyces humicola TaxID=2953240 RepID=A0ABT1PNY9_9ACTN|nr:hypothetical protein [Streptomyces humicola]MCQ4079389.1 hypothetical protein [Streptomyces humicola]